MNFNEKAVFYSETLLQLREGMFVAVLVGMLQWMLNLIKEEERIKENVKAFVCYSEAIPSNGKLTSPEKYVN